MAAINFLSIREENELCVSIAGELADYLQAGAVSHALIRETLLNCVAIHGNTHPNEFFVETVVSMIGERLDTKPLPLVARVQNLVCYNN